MQQSHPTFASVRHLQFHGVRLGASTSWSRWPPNLALRALTFAAGRFGMLGRPPMMLMKQVALLLFIDTSLLLRVRVLWARVRDFPGSPTLGC